MARLRKHIEQYKVALLLWVVLLMVIEGALIAYYYVEDPYGYTVSMYQAYKRSADGACPLFTNVRPCPAWAVESMERQLANFWPDAFAATIPLVTRIAAVTGLPIVVVTLIRSAILVGPYAAGSVRQAAAERRIRRFQFGQVAEDPELGIAADDLPPPPPGIPPSP